MGDPRSHSGAQAPTRLCHPPRCKGPGSHYFAGHTVATTRFCHCAKAAKDSAERNGHDHVPIKLYGQKRVLWDHCPWTPCLGPLHLMRRAGKGELWGCRACGRLWGPGPEVTYVASTHILSARTQWHGPISLQRGLGNVVLLCPGETQAQGGFLQWSSVPSSCPGPSFNHRQTGGLPRQCVGARTARVPGRKSAVDCRSGTEASPSPFARRLRHSALSPNPPGGFLCPRGR